VARAGRGNHTQDAQENMLVRAARAVA